MLRVLDTTLDLVVGFDDINRCHLYILRDTYKRVKSSIKPNQANQKFKFSDAIK